MRRIMVILLATLFTVICVFTFQLAKAKELKNKDKFKYPKIIGQVGKGFFRMFVKGDYIYIAQRKSINKISILNGKAENIVTLDRYVSGFAIHDNTIYFSFGDNTAIHQIDLNGGEPTVFADLRDLNNYSKSVYALAADEEHIFCAQGMKLMRVPKAGDTVYSLADVTTLSGQAICVDDNFVYYANTNTIFIREKGKDIANVKSFGGIYINNSMASNNKAFYFANNITTKNDEIYEVILSDKKVRVFPVTSFRDYKSSISPNSIACDKEQVYFSANNSGVWYSKTGADKFEVVEDTKGMDCEGMAVDEKYIYFIIKRSLFKMTKPIYKG